MGLIREEIEIVGTRKTKRILALFDSGAFRNYIREILDDGETPDDIGFHIYEGRHDAILATGDIAPGERIRFKQINIGGLILNNPSFVIMENLSEHAIIGAEVMQDLGISLDLPEERIIVKKDE